MNITTIIDARLVEDPKELELGGNKVTKIRVADNPFDDKRNEARYVDCLCGRQNAAVAAKLKQGDVVTVSGNMLRRKYETKTGGTGYADEIPFVDVLRVQKSESFFASKKTEAEPGPAPTDNKIPF